jgi:hypothetical protein
MVAKYKKYHVGSIFQRGGVFFFSLSFLFLPAKKLGGRAFPAREREFSGRPPRVCVWVRLVLCLALARLYLCVVTVSVRSRYNSPFSSILLRSLFYLFPLLSPQPAASPASSDNDNDERHCMTNLTNPLYYPRYPLAQVFRYALIKTNNTNNPHRLPPARALLRCRCPPANLLRCKSHLFAPNPRTAPPECVRVCGSTSTCCFRYVRWQTRHGILRSAWLRNEWPGLGGRRGVVNNNNQYTDRQTHTHVR